MSGEMSKGIGNINLKRSSMPYTYNLFKDLGNNFSLGIRNSIGFLSSFWDSGKRFSLRNGYLDLFFPIHSTPDLEQSNLTDCDVLSE